MSSEQCHIFSSKMFSETISNGSFLKKSFVNIANSMCISILDVRTDKIR